MTAIQEAKLNMYHAVQLHCNNNSELVATNTAFSNSLDAFEQNLDGIEAATTQQSEKITGITADKSAAKKALAQLASALAANVFAYASENENNALKEKVNYSVSALLSQRDDQLVPVCQVVINAANDNLTDLADYGVTAKSIKAVQDAMTAFTEMIPANTTAKSSRKSSGKDLKKLFKDADIILKERMDKLVLNFTSTDEYFVSVYMNTRSIVNPSFKKKKKAEAAAISQGNKENKKDQLSKVA